MSISRSWHWKQNKYWIVMIIGAKVLRSFKIAVVHLEVHDLKSSFVMITRNGWLSSVPSEIRTI